MARPAARTRVKPKRPAPQPATRGRTAVLTRKSARFIPARGPRAGAAGPAPLPGRGGGRVT